MTEQTQPSLAEQLIALGTAANRRLKDELESKPFNETRYKIVKSLAKFLKIGTQIKLSPSDHKFDDLIGVLTATHTHGSDNPFEVMHRHFEEGLDRMSRFLNALLLIISHAAGLFCARVEESCCAAALEKRGIHGR